MVAAVLYRVLGRDFGWYVIGPNKRSVRKFVSKPAADFLNAMVLEELAEEPENISPTNPRIVDDVCVCVHFF